MNFRPCNKESHRAWRAFTLVEMMVVMATVVILVGSVIAANLFGLSMSMRQQIWLGASGDSAQSIGLLMEDIRSACALEVGAYSNNVFTPAGTTNQQSGNAIEIWPTTNTTPWTIYYYNPSGTNLVRTNYYGTNGDYKEVTANQITNDSTQPIFTEVDYTGTPFANVAAVSVMPPAVRVYLSYVKLQDPDVPIEPGSMVDLYQIVTTITPRVHQ